MAWKDEQRKYAGVNVNLGEYPQLNEGLDRIQSALTETVFEIAVENFNKASRTAEQNNKNDPIWEVLRASMKTAGINKEVQFAPEVQEKPKELPEGQVEQPLELKSTAGNMTWEDEKKAYIALVEGKIKNLGEKSPTEPQGVTDEREGWQAFLKSLREAENEEALDFDIMPPPSLYFYGFGFDGSWKKRQDDWFKGEVQKIKASFYPGQEPLVGESLWASDKDPSESVTLSQIQNAAKEEKDYLETLFSDRSKGPANEKDKQYLERWMLCDKILNLKTVDEAKVLLGNPANQKILFESKEKGPLGKLWRFIKHTFTKKTTQNPDKPKAERQYVSGKEKFLTHKQAFARKMGAITKTGPIEFYRTQDNYAYLANTYPSPMRFRLGNKTFKLSCLEVGFQGGKFRGTPSAEAIMNSGKVGGDARKMGYPKGDGTYPKPEDLQTIKNPDGTVLTNAEGQPALLYDNPFVVGGGLEDKKVKEAVMKDFILCRVTQDPALLLVLLENKHREFIERTDLNPGGRDDPFWGCGKDKKGRNALGKIYKEVAQELAAELAKTGEIRVRDCLSEPVADRLGVPTTAPSQEKITQAELDSYKALPAVQDCLWDAGQSNELFKKASEAVQEKKEELAQSNTNTQKLS